MAFIKGSANYSTHGFIPTHFSAQIPVKLDTKCLALDCVNRSWESEFEGGGDITRIREIGDISIADYTSYDTLTYETVTESYQDFVIDQQKAFRFKIDKIEQHQSDIDLWDSHADRAAVALHKTVDTHLLSGMTAAVPVYNTLGATTLGHTITLTSDNVYDVLVDLNTLLREANADSVTDEMPWLLVPPRIKGVMLKSGKLTPATDMGDMVIRNGVFGEFAGFQVKENTNQPYTGATGLDDGYWSVLGGFNYAYSFAMQINQVEGPFTLETTFGDAMRGLAVYGSKDIRPQGLVKAIVKI